MEPFGVRNVELNRSAERFLPLAFREQVRKDSDSMRYWLDIPGGVTDEMVNRLVGLGKFEFKPHPDFVLPDNRLEVSQYFLQNRIAKIIRYREKADRYLSIRRKNVTVNPMISDKLLKKAKEAENLRHELKATLKSFPRARTEKLAILFKTTTRTIARHIKALKEAGELIRVGSDKTGYWQVIEQPEERKTP